jgi:capsular polysaccharide transport system permease protein
MSSSDARPKVSLSASLAVQLRIIRALMIRDAQGKYSVETLGFFWVIAEPLILTCGVISLWLITDRGKGHGSVSIVALAITAYSHIQLWRLIVLPSIHSIRNSGWLLYHYNVHVFDVIVARAMLLSVAIFTSFVIVSSACILFNVFPPVRDPGLIVLAWCLDTLFVFSFAVVVAGVSEFSEFVEKILHPLMYLTLPLTGAFTMTSWLPPRARVIIEWSPLANAIEMLRAGVYPISVKTYWSVPLIVFSSLALLTVGVPLVLYARRQIQVQ